MWIFHFCRFCIIHTFSVVGHCTIRTYLFVSKFLWTKPLWINVDLQKPQTLNLRKLKHIRTGHTYVYPSVCLVLASAAFIACVFPAAPLVTHPDTMTGLRRSFLCRVRVSQPMNKGEDVRGWGKGVVGWGGGTYAHADARELSSFVHNFITRPTKAFTSHHLSIGLSLAHTYSLPAYLLSPLPHPHSTLTSLTLTPPLDPHSSLTLTPPSHPHSSLAPSLLPCTLTPPSHPQSSLTPSLHPHTSLTPSLHPHNSLTPSLLPSTPGHCPVLLC